jgi:hypothetical protein
MRQSCSGRTTGSDRSITCCTSVKITVVAPMPRARVRTATAVKPGDSYPASTAASRQEIKR